MPGDRSTEPVKKVKDKEKTKDRLKQLKDRLASLKFDTRGRTESIGGRG